jgi:hypothetical protein
MRSYLELMHCETSQHQTAEISQIPKLAWYGLLELESQVTEEDMGTSLGAA